MKRIAELWKSMTVKRKGWTLVGAGAACLAASLVLLLTTESVFSTVFLYASLVLNVAGAYIIMWKKDRGEKDDS